MRRAIPVLLAAAALAGAPVARPLELYEVAVLPFFPQWGRLVAGDADHDGRVELYLFRPESTTVVLERTTGFKFDTTRIIIGGEYPICWSLGDPDRDGKADLIVQEGDHRFLSVYESRTPASFPDSLVWHDNVEEGSVWYISTGQADTDSLTDFLVCNDNEGIYRVYECKSDDHCEWIASVGEVPPARDPKLTALLPDLDRDGRPELVAGDRYGWLTFYEPVADDSLEPVVQCSLRLPAEPFVSYPRVLLPTPDIDGDGRDELFVLSVNIGDEEYLSVLECPQDDSVETVWQAEYGGNLMAEHGGDWGDLDGDSVVDVVISCTDFTGVFNAFGNDSFGLVWSGWNVFAPLVVIDIDGDGRDEIAGRSDREESKVLSATPVSIGGHTPVGFEPRPDRAAGLRAGAV